MTAYSLDELPQEEMRLRAPRRVAHLLLRDCVSRKTAELRLVAETCRAEIAEQDGWTPVMEFPPAVYDLVVQELEDIGATPGGSETATRPVVLRLGETEVPVSVAHHGTRGDRQEMSFTFRYPAV